MFPRRRDKCYGGGARRCQLADGRQRCHCKSKVPSSLSEWTTSPRSISDLVIIVNEHGNTCLNNTSTDAMTAIEIFYANRPTFPATTITTQKHETKRKQTCSLICDGCLHVYTTYSSTPSHLEPQKKNKMKEVFSRPRLCYAIYLYTT